MNDSTADICIIEPFYGGSHKQLIDLLQSELNETNLKYDLYTLPSKKWHWRARCSALHFSNQIKRPPHKYRVLFASSVLNLAELIALRPDLATCKKVIYFHENQLTYPVRKQSTRNKNQIENKEQRDFQYGYNQILTSLVADKIVFNSNYNRRTFLENINSFLKVIPDNRYKINTKTELEHKASVVYFPINLNENLVNSIIAETLMSNLVVYLNYEDYLNRPVNILWSNRWEHDKNPEEFFEALFKINDMGINFRLHVIGEQFSEIPEIFETAKNRLKDKIDTWGYLPSKLDYYKVLSKCDIVLSTSIHEFFGVAIIEACLFGSYPIVPNRLVYPEIYPKECCYSTEAQLLKKLKSICSKPKQFRLSKLDNSNGLLKINFDSYKWLTLKNEFMSLFL